MNVDHNFCGVICFEKIYLLIALLILFVIPYGLWHYLKS